MIFQQNVTSDATVCDLRDFWRDGLPISLTYVDVSGAIVFQRHVTCDATN